MTHLRIDVLFLLAGCLLSLTMRSQTIWDNPFESTLRTHEHKAWTFSAGAAMVMGMPSTLNSAQILNHGSVEEPVLDTLHLGIWNSNPQIGWQVAMGHLWLQENRLWSDRFSVSVNVSQTRLKESFLGNVKGAGIDTSVAFVEELIWAQGSAMAVGLDVQSMRGIAAGPEGFCELRTGIRGSYNWSQNVPERLPNFFDPVSLPSWHVAWTLGLGAGLKIYRGRMVRLTVDVDVLQLAQASVPEVVRATDADVRGLNWLQSGYRPWRITIHHDLYRRKPEAGCAAPTRSTASKTLFDPKMKGVGKAKHKGLKKALKNRDD